MSEEVRNAPIVIPRILVQTIAINGGLAFAFVLVLLFCIGDIEKAMSTATGYPIIQIFYQATGSVKAATAMMASITIIGMASSIGVVASVSRLTWAFARDGGLPFSKFFAHVRQDSFLLKIDCADFLIQVDSKHHVPFRAIGLVSITVVLLSLINIGSSTALSALLALTNISLYVSYLIPIFLVLLKRLRKEPIQFGPWTLGRWGLAVNLYAIVFGVFVCIFVPFPPIIPVTAENMNYCAPVFLVLIVLLGFDWAFRGRITYTGPLRKLLQPTDREQNGLQSN
jgi:choline transport protein